MCEFLSAVVLANGDIICRPDVTDSHEDLLLSAGVRDGLCQQDRFARVEFTPPDPPTQIADPATWTLRVDEQATPDWLDEDRVRADLSARVACMIVDDARPLLLGGCWILVGEAHVDRAVNARILMLRDSSQVISDFRSVEDDGE